MSKSEWISKKFSSFSSVRNKVSPLSYERTNQMNVLSFSTPTSLNRTHNANLIHKELCEIIGFVIAKQGQDYWKWYKTAEVNNAHKKAFEMFAHNAPRSSLRLSKRIGGRKTPPAARSDVDDR